MAESDDRTEAATPRRQQRAREAGQVPLSREASTFAVLGAIALVSAMAAPALFSGAARALARLLAQTDRLTAAQGAAIAGAATLRLAGPFVIAALLAGTGAVVAQIGFLFNLSALMPDLSRLDPRRGLRRIGGRDTLLDAGKSVIKIAVIAAILWHAIAGLREELPVAIAWEPLLLLTRTWRQVVHVLLAVLAVQAAITVLDILRARLQHVGGLRMSRQEVREEHRETEGDPRMKARRRALQRQRAKRRMLAAVPKATVVVTNPTHYAVALTYDQSRAAAPRVVAKGVDAMAARIRAVAEENRVPLVVNPPLARALHQVELDSEIPAEHYKAVAEIIAYVWRLRGRRQGRR
jgi:flagellar biosynthetic protein FlhB